MVTVAELIAQLQAFPPSAMVVVKTSDGVQSVNGLSPVTIGRVSVSGAGQFTPWVLAEVSLTERDAQVLNAMLDGLQAKTSVKLQARGAVVLDLEEESDAGDSVETIG